MLERQESGRSLQEALEKLATEWAHMDCRVDLPENAQWGEGCAQGYSNAAADLLRLLAAHPVEPVPDRQPSDAAIEAYLVAAGHTLLHGHKVAQARAGLEAAYRVDAPRPLLDRDAVENAIATKVMYYDSGTAVHEVDDNDLAGLTAGTDAVMDLARPMPTKAELADWLRETFTADTGGTSWELAAECLLIAMNGEA